MLAGTNLVYEMGERTRAIVNGGSEPSIFWHSGQG